MLSRLLRPNMHIPLSASSGVEVLALHARSQRNLGDRDFVFALRRFDVGGPDVGYPAATSAEGSIAMVADDSLAHNLAVAVPASLLDLCTLGLGEERMGARCVINANVPGSCLRCVISHDSLRLKA